MSGVDSRDALAELGSFVEVPPEALRRITGSARLVEVASGDLVVEEGSPADHAYVLISGSLEVSKRVLGEDYPLAHIDDAGTVIGEVAILAGGKRTATIRAARPSRLIELGRSSFEELLGHAPKLAGRLAEEALARMEETELRTFLARTLGTDDPVILAEVARTASWLRLPGGQVLFKEGDPADAAYVIVSGRLGLSAPGSDQHIELGRGEFLGELGLIEGGNRSMTAATLRDSVLVRFPTEAFDALMEGRPSLMLQVARTIVRRARKPARGSTGAMVIAVAVVGDIDRRATVARFSAHLAELGKTEHVGPARVEALLGRPGSAEAGAGDPAEMRVVHLLQEFELLCSYLFLEVDGAGPAWANRCLRHADRVVVICGSQPSSEERGRIRELLAGANPAAHRVLVVGYPPTVSVPSGSAALVAETGATRAINIRLGSPAELARVARVVTGRAYGLVLSGGGARGFAHIGVYKAMSELGMPIDWVGGSSIGSVFAALIALDLEPDVIEKLTERVFRGVLDYTLPVVSLVKGARITSNIEEVVGTMDVEDLWRGFFCISTNLTRSVRQIHDRGSVSRSVRASVAIPGVIPPVPWGEDLLVDGGVMDNLPVGTMRSIHPKGTIIAIDLAPSLGPRAKADFGLSVSGWKALASKTRRSKLVYPSIAAVLMRSMITASESQRSMKHEDSDLYIDLDLRGVGILEFDVVRPVVLAGYEQSMPRLEAWLGDRTETG
ncbi:MAG: cyclic nucleotide-binding domain-containing protein [Actinomycetota bacterium]